VSLALTLLSRIWPYLLGGAAAIAAWLYADHRGYSRAEAIYTAQIAQLQADVRQKTAEAQAQAIEAARNQEVAATRITQDVSDEYQARIAALRARYDGLLAKARADQGGSRETDVPGVPDAASGPDAATCEAGFPAEDALIASIQAEQLVGLQEWVRQQQKNAETAK